MLKKLSYLLLITVMFSCTKEEGTTDTLKKELTDTWTYGTITQDDYDANGNLLKSARLPVLRDKDFVTFKDDGSYIETRAAAKEPITGTYNITNTKAFTLKIGTTTSACRIVNLSLNDLNFVVADPKVKGQPYTEYTHSLYR
jgi:hypothetical protein